MEKSGNGGDVDDIYDDRARAVEEIDLSKTADAAGATAIAPMKSDVDAPLPWWTVQSLRDFRRL